MEILRNIHKTRWAKHLIVVNNSDLPDAIVADHMVAALRLRFYAVEGENLHEGRSEDTLVEQEAMSLAASGIVRKHGVGGPGGVQVPSDIRVSRQ